MYNSVIRSDDKNAFEKLNENYEFFKNRREYMIKVNKYFEENGTVEGCPGVDQEAAILLDTRMKEEQDGPYPKSFFDDNKEMLDWLQSIMNRVAEKPETLFKGWQFNGGETVINLANKRLQLMFNEKPSDERISVLKQNGFKWAPKGKAWQIPLALQAMSVCDKIGFIKPTNGRKPSDIQPKFHKKNEPER
ncbi:MAG: hypothetical protein K5664_04650 [Firmicutes bacterium]|nr:hypothetical protein [Bacillota bacterium]